jgi:hypothetical protein
MIRRHLLPVLFVVFALVLVAAVPGPLAAAVVGPPAEHFASDATTEDGFGTSIAIDGSTAVVGAPGTTYSGKPGKVYVFEAADGAWSEVAVLTAPTPVAAEGFGYAVDIDGSSILVGVRDEDAGRAHVFVGSGSSWSHQATLTPSAGAAGSFFGRDVDIDGDRALIGASGHDGVGPNHGAAFAYERSGSTWSETLVLTSPNPSTNGLFGDAVALDGSRGLVGAANEKAAGFSLAGSVYEFDIISGALTETIEPPDRQAFHGFGTSLAIDGATLVVGANGDHGPDGFDPTCTGSSTAICNPGSIYVYDETPSGFVLDSELHAPDLDLIDNYSPGAELGLETAIEGGRIVVGARYSDEATTSAGRVYVFDRAGGGWVHSGSHTPADARSSDLFGTAVAIGPGDQVLGGAPHDDTVNAVWTPNEGSFTAVNVSRPPAGGPIEVGIEPRALAAVDFDGDGDVDIVVVNVVSADLSLLQNDGLGNLTEASTISTIGRATDLEVHDMDGDGIDDLVLAVREDDRGVSILYGDGAGGFGDALFVPAGPRPHYVAVADLDADGRDDIVVSHCCGLTHDGNVFLSVMMATGPTSYAAPVTLATGASIGGEIEIGDIDGDGNLDVVTNIAYSGALVTWLGDGAGTFGSPQSTAGLIPTTTFGLVDVDADGSDELVVGDGTTTIDVLENGSTPGTVSWSSGSTVTTPSGVDWVDVGDVDGDGNDDVLATNRAGGTLTVIRSSATPIVADEVAAGTNASRSIAVDLQGTGPPDLAVTDQLDNPATGTVTILRWYELP